MISIGTTSEKKIYIYIYTSNLDTHKSDWFSLRLFNALNISTTTSTVIETVEGCLSLNTVQEYFVSLVEQLSKFT